MYWIKQAMPCILQLENHTLQKLFFFLLHEGLANERGKLLGQKHDTMSMNGRG